MMCSGTKYSHGKHFIHEMFLILFSSFFNSGCSHWGGGGVKLLILQSDCVSAASKTCLNKSFVRFIHLDKSVLLTVSGSISSVC